jgi:hypothetical protein
MVSTRTDARKRRRTPPHPLVGNTSSTKKKVKKQKKPAKRAKCNSTGGVSEEEEEYEVEALLDVREGKVGCEFCVKWAGYEEWTWELESKLPAPLVAAFRKKAMAAKDDAPSAPDMEAETKEEEGDEDKEEKALTSSRRPAIDESSAQVATVVCATCGEGDGVGRKCYRCEKPMHHFCANDVCMSLALIDESGSTIEEFPDDACFCSRACYWNRARSVRASAFRIESTAPSRHTALQSESDEDYEYGGNSTDEDNRKGQAKIRSKEPAPKPSINAKPPASAQRPGLPKKTKPAKKSGEKAVNPVLNEAGRDPLIGKSVTFLVENEEWMPHNLYKTIKGFMLTGRVFKPKPKNERVAAGVYEVRWCHTDYQGAKFVHRIKSETVKRGIETYSHVSGGVLSKVTWQKICQGPSDNDWSGQDSLDDYTILEEPRHLYESYRVLPENIEQIEQLKSLDFQAGRKMKEPEDLFRFDDGTTATRVKKKHRDRFATASSSFFAYLPLSFWRKVVVESNAYAEALKQTAITLDELMTMFGIMFYMSVVDKGEYSNYWGDQVEGKIFGVGGTGLSGAVMTLKRFKYIRQNLCFRFGATPENLKKDPVARIRPLINMLKHTSPLYIDLGRNVAVDESSIACRSKFGRHLIVYNSSKPTGKFHFKIYACCCATTWLMVGFRLHCNSDLDDRLEGVLPSQEVQNLKKRLHHASEIRKHVLEVTRPLHGSRRIVNTDNFYTSVQLLMSLREVGMYGRGTVRENSKHFPKAHMFHKKANEPRGTFMQGVSSTGDIIAASWMDGNAVNIVSNADASEQGEVTRLIGKEPMAFPAPMCIVEYNKYMQGVDRLDQLRAKYSLADGHSFQKWHKKLAMAFIDIARCNAYVTRCLVMDDQPKSRNAHRDFMVDLAAELVTGRWKESVQDEGMFFADPQASTGPTTPSVEPSTPSTPTELVCRFILSSKQFPDASRGKRGCKVCLFEGRYETVKTNYCLQHNVCLCSGKYPTPVRLAGILCPHEDWSCWRKFHEFYLPNGLFNRQGRILRASSINKAKRELSMVTESSVAQRRSWSAGSLKRKKWYSLRWRRRNDRHQPQHVHPLCHRQ